MWMWIAGLVYIIISICLAQFVVEYCGYKKSIGLYIFLTIMSPAILGFLLVLLISEFLKWFCNQ